MLLLHPNLTEMSSFVGSFWLDFRFLR